MSIKICCPTLLLILILILNILSLRSTKCALYLSIPMNQVGRVYNYYLQDVNYLWCIKDVKLHLRQKSSLLPMGDAIWKYACNLWTLIRDFLKLLQPYYLATIVLFKGRPAMSVSFSLNDTKTSVSFFPHPFPLLSCFLSTSAGVCNSFIMGVALSISHVGGWAKLTHLPLCCLARQEPLPGIQVGCRVWDTGD